MYSVLDLGLSSIALPPQNMAAKSNSHHDQHSHQNHHERKSRSAEDLLDVGLASKPVTDNAESKDDSHTGIYVSI